MIPIFGKSEKVEGFGGVYNPLSFTYERKAIKLLCIEVELMSVSDKPNIKL